MKRCHNLAVGRIFQYPIITLSIASLMLEEVQKVFSLSEEDRKQEVILKKKDDVFYMFLNRKANTFTHDFVRTISKALDKVEQSEGPAALVTVSLSKLFSGGLDLKYATSLPHEAQGWFVLEFIQLLGRVTALPFPTIALVKGGAVAGGCMLSFAHDSIFVADKALFACNEVDIGLPLPPGMMEIIKKKHSNYKSLRDMTNYGKKYDAQEALKEGFIDEIVKTSEAMRVVHAKAQELSNYGSNRANFKKIKMEQHKVVVDACYNKQHAVGTIGQTIFPVLPKL